MEYPMVLNPTQELGHTIRPQDFVTITVVQDIPTMEVLLCVSQITVLANRSL